jgi:hypothetical protein
MTITGFAYTFIALVYILALSVCAWRSEMYSPNRIGIFGLIVAWLIPPIYWYRFTDRFARNLPAIFMAICMTASIVLSLYCLMFISGLLGVHSHLSLTIATILWFMVPAITTLAFIFSRFERQKGSGVSDQSKG